MLRSPHSLDVAPSRLTLNRLSHFKSCEREDALSRSAGRQPPIADAYPSAVSMYRCEQCKEVVGPRIPQLRAVTETRVKLYPVREAANHVMKRGKLVWVDDAGGEGREIVRELALCARCMSTRD